MQSLYTNRNGVPPSTQNEQPFSPTTVMKYFCLIFLLFFGGLLYFRPPRVPIIPSHYYLAPISLHIDQNQVGPAQYIHRLKQIQTIDQQILDKRHSLFDSVSPVVFPSYNSATRKISRVDESSTLPSARLFSTPPHSEEEEQTFGNIEPLPIQQTTHTNPQGAKPSLPVKATTAAATASPSTPERSVPAIFSSHHIIVTMTTIPDRMEHLHDTLLSLFTQTVPPNEIVLNVPYLSHRFRDAHNNPQPYHFSRSFIQYIGALARIFNHQDGLFNLKMDPSLDQLFHPTSSDPFAFTAPSASSSFYPTIEALVESFQRLASLYKFSSLSRSPTLTIQRCDDDGPATKLLPTLGREFELERMDSIIIIADDDVTYPLNWVETFVGYYLSQSSLHHSALGMRGYCLPPSNVWEWNIMKQIMISSQQLYAMTLALNIPLQPREARDALTPSPNPLYPSSATAAAASPPFTPNLGSSTQRTKITPNAHRFIHRLANYTIVKQSGAYTVKQYDSDPPAIFSSVHLNPDWALLPLVSDLDLTTPSSSSQKSSIVIPPRNAQDDTTVNTPIAQYPIQHHMSSELPNQIHTISQWLEHHVASTSPYTPIDNNQIGVLQSTPVNLLHLSHTQVDIITANNGFLVRPYYFSHIDPFIGKPNARSIPPKNGLHQSNVPQFVSQPLTNLDQLSGLMNDILPRFGHSHRSPSSSHNSPQIDSFSPAVCHHGQETQGHFFAPDQFASTSENVHLLYTTNADMFRQLRLNNKKSVASIIFILKQIHSMLLQTHRKNIDASGSHSPAPAITSLDAIYAGVQRTAFDCIFIQQATAQLTPELKTANHAVRTLADILIAAFRAKLSVDLFRVSSNASSRAESWATIVKRNDLVELSHLDPNTPDYESERSALRQRIDLYLLLLQRWESLQLLVLSDIELDFGIFAHSHATIRPWVSIPLEPPRIYANIIESSHCVDLMNQLITSTQFTLPPVVPTSTSAPRASSSLTLDAVFAHLESEIVSLRNNQSPPPKSQQQPPQGSIIGKTPGAAPLPQSVYYMDDMWFNGILAANNITRVVIGNSADPIHSESMQQSTTTLEDVPTGRTFHNNVLLKAFEHLWSNCPQIAPDSAIPEYYLRYYSQSSQSSQEQQEEQLKLLNKQSSLASSSSSSSSSSSPTKSSDQQDPRNTLSNPWAEWHVPDTETNVHNTHYLAGKPEIVSEAEIQSQIRQSAVSPAAAEAAILARQRAQALAKPNKAAQTNSQPAVKDSPPTAITNNHKNKPSPNDQNSADVVNVGNIKSMFKQYNQQFSEDKLTTTTTTAPN